MPKCGSCKLPFPNSDDSIGCDKCKKNTIGHVQNLNNMLSNYTKKTLTNPGDARHVLTDTAKTVTKLSQILVRTVFAVISVPSGSIRAVLD